MRRWLLPPALVLASAGCLDRADFEWQGESRFPDPRPFPTAGATPSPLPEQIDFGDGRTGPLIVNTTRAINTCSSVTLGTNGTITRPLAAPVVAVGTRVVVWQVTDAFATSGDPSAVQEPAAGDAGRFTLTRVVDAGPPLVVDPPLSHRYASTATKQAQLCTVPEFTSLTVEAGGRIRPVTWNGTTGGLAMALVNGSCVIDGDIDAVGAGFRGGPQSGLDCTANSTALDEPVDLAGRKGGGLHAGSVNAAGRGNLANAGGGGNACDAGGGGGGNGGAGGFGGRAGLGSMDDTRGMPGAAVLLSPLSHLVLGGGGGGGHEDLNTGSAGGTGGGVVVLACRSMSGMGRIEANGVSAALAGDPFDNDGAGGGGAGGTIVILTSSASMISDRIRADGGSGGLATDSTTVRAGPGGGGGGGRILLRNVTSFEISANAGPNGVGTTTLDAWGATPGGTGLVTTE